MARTRPPFVHEVKQAHPDQEVRVWFQDEARFGQQGTLTHVWAERGSRPTALKQTEYDFAYLMAAVDPLTGASSALITPTVNTLYMNEHLRFISQEAGPGVHVVLVLDNAGWHIAKELKVPTNLTLLPLPPYSPELNPVERLWSYLKSHYLSNRVYEDYQDMLDVSTHAWNELTPDHLKTICHAPWLKPANLS